MSLLLKKGSSAIAKNITYAKEDALAGPLGPAGPANDLSNARPSTTSIAGIGLVTIPNGVKLIHTK